MRATAQRLIICLCWTVSGQPRYEWISMPVLTQTARHRHSIGPNTTQLQPVDCRSKRGNRQCGVHQIQTASVPMARLLFRWRRARQLCSPMEGKCWTQTVEWRSALYANSPIDSCSVHAVSSRNSVSNLVFIGSYVLPFWWWFCCFRWTKWSSACFNLTS